MGEAGHIISSKTDSLFVFCHNVNVELFLHDWLFVEPPALYDVHYIMSMSYKFRYAYMPIAYTKSIAKPCFLRHCSIITAAIAYSNPLKVIQAQACCPC